MIFSYLLNTKFKNIKIIQKIFFIFKIIFSQTGLYIIDHKKFEFIIFINFLNRLIQHINGT